MQSVIQCTATVARVLCDRYDGHASLGVVRCGVAGKEKCYVKYIKYMLVDLEVRYVDRWKFF
jgi:hypothetical protein